MPAAAAKVQQAPLALTGMWARDLCTLSAAEMETKWIDKQGDAGEEIEYYNPGALAGLEDHNPIFHLAVNVFFANDPSLLDIDFHRKKICREMLFWYFDQNREYEGSLIMAQRDSYKTTFAHGVLALFLAMRDWYVHERDTRILLLHHKLEQASRNLVKLKTMCTQSKYLEKYWSGTTGEPVFFWKEDVGTMKAFDWPHKIQGLFTENSVMASGLNAGLTGWHFDYKLDDDLVTDDHIDSKIVREDAIFKYGSTRFLLDTKLGKELNTGTPYHMRDLWANLEAAKDPETGKPLYRCTTIPAGGERAKKPLSYPSRHTEQFLERMRTTIMEREGNDNLWWLNMQCERRAPGVVVTKREWLNYISRGALQKKFGERGLPVIILCDPAWKGTENSGKGCDAAIAAIGFDRKGHVVNTYLLDLLVSNEMSSLDGMREISEMMIRWSTPRCAVEETSSHNFRTDLKQHFVELRRPLHLIDFKTKWRAKPDRITTFLRRVEAGNFHIMEECPNLDTFLSQYDDFPQLNKDDALDCIAYCADPNVSNLYAPMWNEEDGEEDVFSGWQPELDSFLPQRTRHCGV